MVDTIVAYSVQGPPGAAGKSTYLNVQTYGAKGDVLTFADGSMVSGSATLTSPTATFTQADVGKTVVVGGAALNAYQGTVTATAGTVTGSGTNFGSIAMDGGQVSISGVTYAIVGTAASDTSMTVTPTTNSAAGQVMTGPAKPLTTTIAAWASAHQVTLSASATVTVSGITFQYGTDDTNAFQSAANASNGIMFVPAGSYFIGSTITLPNVGTAVCGENNGTILVGTTPALIMFTPAAGDQRFEDLKFMGQAVDSSTGGFAIKCISTTAVLKGTNVLNAGALTGADSFTITIDAGLPTAKVQLITFTGAESTVPLVLNRINNTFGPGIYNYRATQSDDGTGVQKLYLYSATAGASSTVSVSGNATTLSRLGFTTTSATGTGAPAPRCRVKSCVFTGPDTSRAFNNGIKFPDGCDDTLCDDLLFIRLAGDNGVTGAGYGGLFAQCARLKFTNVTFFGTALGGRHPVYISGGCTKPIVDNLHAYNSRNNSISCFTDQREPPCVGAIFSNFHIEGQLLGPQDSAAVCITGYVIDAQIVGGVIVDCANNGVICTSYTFGTESAPTRVQVLGTQVVRPGRNGVVFSGAQGCIAKNVRVIDASQQGLNLYSPYAIQSNGNVSPALACDSCIVAECTAEVSSGKSALYQQAIRCQPVSGGGTPPTNCLLANNVLDPGTGADSNGKLICLPVPAIALVPYVTVVNNAARLLTTHTANNNAPSVLGTNYIVINFSGDQPLNNLNDGYEGQEVTLYSATSHCQIQANANFVLRDGIAWSMPTGAWIKLRFRGSTDETGANGKWCELNRSHTEIVRPADGSGTGVAYGFASEPTLGFWRTSSHTLAFQSNGHSTALFGATSHVLYSATTARFTIDDVGIGFYGLTTCAQQTRAGQLTDSTGGSIVTTIPDMGAAYVQASVNEGFASLIAKINRIDTILHTIGIST